MSSRNLPSCFHSLICKHRQAWCPRICVCIFWHAILCWWWIGLGWLTVISSFHFFLHHPHPSSDLAEEACEEEIWALWDVFWRWCQQWCLECLLWALVWFQERRHSPLPAADRGCGRSSQPLRQLKLVREERRASGPAELTEEPENTEVRAVAQWAASSPYCLHQGCGGVLMFVEPLWSSRTKGAKVTETQSLPSRDFEIAGKFSVVY